MLQQQGQGRRVCLDLRRVAGLQGCVQDLKATHLESGEVWLNRGNFRDIQCCFSLSLPSLRDSPVHLLHVGDMLVLQMVFVDDMEWVAEGPKGLRCILIAILMMIIVGVPFAWHKFRGGVTHDWIGFRVCLRSRSIGLGPKRTEWLVHWLTANLNTGLVKIADMVSVQGRLMFASTALEIMRPFLGPISVSHLDVLPLPAAI